MFRFYLSLLAGKTYLFFAKLTHNERSDKVAFLVDRICPEFLNKVKKPKLIVSVTGTNGKTTTTSIVAQGLKLNGMKVAYNDWGANLYSGHIRCFLDTVNIFNKSIMDAIVLESDELTIGKTLQRVKPDYLIVTNVCRDSIRRNAYPEFISNTLDEAIKLIPDATIILNADDPLSSFIGKKNKRVYVSVNKFLEDAKENNANDFTCCPKCNGKIKYEYRHYRHIGKFKCLECGFKSIDADYKVDKIDYDKKLIYVDKNPFRLVSNTIFNVYNEVTAIAFFRTYGYDTKKIAKMFNDITVPASRENKIEVNGHNIYLRMAKGQNGSAASSVFESLVKDNKKKQLVLIFDEDYVSHVELDAEETITWLYDTDYEFLNNPVIEKIIIPSKLLYDYKLRLEMAGIDQKKFVCIRDYNEAYKEVNLKSKSDIYVLYEVDDRPQGLKVADMIKNRIEEEEK